LEILEATVNPASDVEVKIDALALVEYIIKLPDIEPELKKYSPRLMSKILIPATIWKAGRPNVKIRKAGVVCIFHLVERDLIPEETLLKLLDEFKGTLKSCLNDDFAPDLRFSACCLMESFLRHLTNLLSDYELKDLYPILLERLDDSQDMIRIEISKSISAFFQCKQLKFSPSIFEYVIRNIKIHLDDQNEQIQMAIFNLLKEAANIDAQKVLEETREFVNKQKYPRKCQELIRYIEEHMEEYQEREKEREKERQKEKQQIEISHDVEKIEEEKSTANN